MKRTACHGWGDLAHGCGPELSQDLRESSCVMASAQLTESSWVMASAQLPGVCACARVGGVRVGGQGWAICAGSPARHFGAGRAAWVQKCRHPTSARALALGSQPLVARERAELHEQRVAIVLANGSVGVGARRRRRRWLCDTSARVNAEQLPTLRLRLRAVREVRDDRVRCAHRCEALAEQRPRPDCGVPVHPSASASRLGCGRRHACPPSRTACRRDSAKGELSR